MTNHRVEFRLLGSVEIVVNGSVVPLPSRRQRVALALLLLEAGRVVSVDRLIDAIWGDSPPETARNQVQITISSLRRLAAGGAADPIIRHAGGYLIRVPDEAIDLRRFEALAVSGTAAGAERRPTEAVEQLRAALAIWRGPALLDLDGSVVEMAAARLNERRLSIMGDCLDLELQLGRHHDVIAELTSLAAEYPLHERFRAQLMLALYRSGRQAEALEVFHAGREILAEELGLDPGAELSGLHQAILANDPRLDLPRSVRLGVLRSKFGSMPAPRQLPRAPLHLTGRDSLLARVRALLTGTGDHVPVAVLTGRSGVGKTALAVRAGQSLSEAFSGGQLFVQLHGDAGEDTAAILGELLRSFGVGTDALPADQQGLMALYRSWLAEHQTLVVIDDAIDAGQVAPFLPGAPGCGAIVTARRPLPGLDSVQEIEVGPIDETASLDLLADALGRTRVQAEPEAAGELARLCEGLPLALRIASAKLAARPHWPIAAMVARLRDRETRLNEFHLDGASLRATLAVSCGGLDGASRRLFRRLTLAGETDFASWIGAPLLASDPAQADERLQDLSAVRFLDPRAAADGGTRFYLHDLVRGYAAELLSAEEPAAERAAAVRRLLGCWLFLVTAAHRRVYGGDFAMVHGAAEHWRLPPATVDGLLSDPVDWVSAEHSAIIAAIRQAGQEGMDELCWDLAVTAGTLPGASCRPDDWRGIQEQALRAVRAAGNRRGEAALLCSLGTLELTSQLEPARELYDRASAMFAECDDLHGRALAASGLATAARLDGSYDRALDCYQQAVAWFRQVADLVGEAEALKSIAQIHTDRQDYENAERLLDEALVLAGKAGTHRVTAQAECALGNLYLDKGRLGQAMSCFESARRVAAAHNDIADQAYAMTGLGNARRMLGDFEVAASVLQTALELGQCAGDRLLRGRTLLALAALWLAKRDDDAAARHAGEALSVLRGLGGAAVWRGRALDLLGHLHQRARRLDRAADSWRTAIELVGDADLALRARLTRAIADSREQSRMIADGHDNA